MTKPTTLITGTAMFTKFAAALTLGLVLFAPLHASEGGAALQSANVSLNDTAALQRGAKLYFNYCAGCHSLRYVRYSRIAEDLQIDPKDVEANLIFTGAKIGDLAINNLSAEDGTKWFGKAPPDLSLEGRSKGADWIYSYLKSFYLDPTRPLGWNNTVFENASMPNVLWELQGVQSAVRKGGAADGPIERLDLTTPGRQSAEEFDRSVRDITAFLQYVGEPAALKRESMGVWVLLYLAVFTLLAYLLKREFWKDVH
ncbi:MAG: cytochrome c1 [Dokdonella sp.]|nr:MAG: cytochrome c1 [Dokdonella sp.]